MKIIVPLRITYTLISFTLVFAFCNFNSIDCSANYSNTTGIHSSDTIVVNKALTSKKYKIKLYPNADQNVLFFSVSGESGKVYQLYLFDIEGKLLKQVQIRNREITVIANMTKGIYTFEVFSDDEKIENGELVIK